MMEMARLNSDTENASTTGMGPTPGNSQHELLIEENAEEIALKTFETVSL
jgi:hypothetical protein